MMLLLACKEDVPIASADVGVPATTVQAAVQHPRTSPPTLDAVAPIIAAINSAQIDKLPTLLHPDAIRDDQQHCARQANCDALLGKARWLPEVARAFKCVTSTNTSPVNPACTEEAARDETYLWLRWLKDLGLTPCEAGDSVWTDTEHPIAAIPLRCQGANGAVPLRLSDEGKWMLTSGYERDRPMNNESGFGWGMDFRIYVESAFIDKTVQDHRWARMVAKAKKQSGGAK